jgi:stearoyl-CoA desaturase (delta-9 desaturase)
MSSTIGSPYRKNNWRNILFFGLTTAFALVGVPLYATFLGFTRLDAALFLFMAFATMMSTTLGYHRLFAHRAFEAHPIVQFFCLFFGAGTFQQSVLTWASQHRDHHRFTDTDRDPYNIRKGFWYAHMGWFLFYEHEVDYSNVRDLASDRMIRHQHDHWLLWAVVAGFAFPLMIGWFAGNLWGALVVSCLLRLAVVHQSIFLINSACHMFGTATYNARQTARDSWVCALLTNGEGYHNFHHAFPNDYRNGIRWYHWDPTKWAIRCLAWAGLTRSLKFTPEVKILAAKIEGRHASFLEAARRAAAHPRWADAVRALGEHTETLKSHLRRWEELLVEYRRLRVDPVASAHLARVARELEDARSRFFEAYSHWARSVREKARLFELGPVV